MHSSASFHPIKKYFSPPLFKVFFFFFFFFLSFILLDFFLSLYSLLSPLSALHSAETSQNTDFIFLKHHRTPSPPHLGLGLRRSLLRGSWPRRGSRPRRGFAPISTSWVSACDVGLCFTCCSCCCCWVLHAFTVYMLVDFGCWVCCLQLGGVVVVAGVWMVEWVTRVEK
jgi:hypothetical protein